MKMSEGHPVRWPCSRPQGRPSPLASRSSPPTTPRARPPVAALAPRAESQTAARVRSHSPEQRPAGKPRRSAPANPQGGRGLGGASQPQAPFVFSLRSDRQKETPDSIPGPRLRQCALAPGSSRERLARRNALGGEPGPSGQECAAQTGCRARFPSVPWIPNSSGLLGAAPLQQRRARSASSRAPRCKRRTAGSGPACSLTRPKGARGQRFGISSRRRRRSPGSASGPPCVPGTSLRAPQGCAFLRV